MAAQQVHCLPPTAIPLYINSNDRRDGQPGSFRCPQISNLEQSERMFGLIVKQVTFENFIPVISEEINDVFSYKLNSTNYDLILTPGQYNALSMADTLQVAFAENAAGMTVVFDETNNTLNAGVPLGTTFFIPRQTAPRVNLLLDKLGWRDNTNIVYTNTTMIGSNICKISSTSHIYVTANIDLQVMSTSPEGLQILCGIGVEYGFGSVISHTPINPNMFRIRAGDVENMIFSMVDEWGYIINFPKTTSIIYHFALVPLYC